MYVRVLAESLMHCQECPLFLGINRKKWCQTLSSVDNSIIALLFECLLCLLENQNALHLLVLFIFFFFTTFLEYWGIRSKKYFTNH